MATAHRPEYCWDVNSLRDLMVNDMKLTPDQLNHLTNRLHQLTPLLVEDLLTSFQAEPALVKRYGPTLRTMAEQGVVSFRNVLLGALQYDVPNILNRELNWLENLLKSRQIDSHRIPVFLQIFRHRLQTELSSAESQPVLALLDQLNSIPAEK